MTTSISSRAPSARQGHSRLRAWVVLACLWTSSWVMADEPFREWKDTSGKFATKAQLVKTTESHVVLLKEDGIKIEVPLDRLSPTDLSYLGLKPKSRSPLGNSPTRSPGSAAMSNGSSDLDDSGLKLALAKMNRGELTSAIEDIRTLMRENPKSRVLRLLLAECLRRDHSPAQAIDVVTQVLDEDPQDQIALEIRANLYMGMTRELEAKRDLEQLLKRGSKNADTLNNLAWLLCAASREELRDGQQALELAKTICGQSNYTNPRYLKTLAAAQAENGNFEEATYWASEAYALAQREGASQLAGYENVLDRLLDQEPIRIKRVSQLTDSSMFAAQRTRSQLEKVLQSVDQKLRSKSTKEQNEGFAALQKLSKTRAPEVTRRLGNAYLNGQGTNKDAAEAARWFQVGHEAGDPSSSYGLGVCYLLGEGVEADQVKAVELLEVAVAEKHAGAAAQLAYLLLNGQGVPQDTKKGMAFVRLAAFKRNPWSMTAYGDMLLRGQYGTSDIARGKYWVTRGAESGDIDGMVLCGHYHLFGNHSDAQPEEGLKWLNKSADAGRLDAMRLLGLHYYLTKSSSRSVNTAIAWLEKAATGGDFNSITTLGEIYLNGDESVRSPSKAIGYLKQGVEAKHPRSMYLYGICSIQGEGIEQDAKLGLELIQQSADLGEANARVLLAEIAKAEREEALRAQEAALAAARAEEAQRAQESNSFMGGSGFSLSDSDREQIGQGLALGILAIGAAIAMGSFGDDSDSYGDSGSGWDDQAAEQRRYQSEYWRSRAAREAESGNHDEARRSQSMAESYSY
jgi:TPR repeat protein